MDAMIAKRTKFVSVEDISKPRSGYVRAHVNEWWVVTPDNEVMLYEGRSPQCNSNQKIAEMIRNKMYPDCSVVQIEQAFVPFDPNDF